jgi:hypothetical protein
MSNSGNCDALIFFVMVSSSWLKVPCKRVCVFYVASLAGLVTAAKHDDRA